MIEEGSHREAQLSDRLSDSEAAGRQLAAAIEERVWPMLAGLGKLSDGGSKAVPSAALRAAAARRVTALMRSTRRSMRWRRRLHRR